jgi:hypothetical protein
MSDKTWLPKFDRQPYFLLELFYVVSLFFFSVVRYGWQQDCWVLDAGNNTAMEPYRAFIADTLNLLNSLQDFKLKVSSLVWANFGKCFLFLFR